MELKTKAKLLLGRIAPKSVKKIVFERYDKCGLHTDLPANWHEYELFLLPLLLKSDSIFVDVGSNLGTYIYQAEKYIDSVNIHAFEPLKEYSAFLSKVFPGVAVNRCALSFEVGQARLSVPLVDGSVRYSRASLAENESVSEAIVESHNVRTTSIDSYVRSKSIESLDLMKVDVEGHEYEVLKGASNTLKKYMPDLIVEIEARYVDHPEKILQFMSDLGYDCLYFDVVKRRMVMLDESLSAVQSRYEIGSAEYINNFVFTQKESVGRLCDSVVNAVIVSESSKRQI